MTRITRRTAIRFAGVMAGAGVAVVGGLLATSSPAFADNGPHISTTGNMTVDRCAGCHRAHTAKAAYLLLQDADALCESCHGSAGTGATTDVVDGMQYSFNTNASPRGASPVGALRAGGFDFALIDTASGVNRMSVNALATASMPGNKVATTSRHQLGTTSTAWGGGAINSSSVTGTDVTLECTSCHDPHGNGNFRILRPIASEGTSTFAPTATISNVVAASGSVVYTTTVAHPFTVGQKVSVSGVTATPTASAFNLTTQTITAVTETSFTITNAATGTYVSGGSAVAVVPISISGAVSGLAADGRTKIITYTTAGAHGLLVGTPVSINGIVGSGTKSAAISAVSGATGSAVTFTTSANTFATGDVVTVAGAVPTAYNGTFAITAVTGTSFTVANTTLGALTTGATASVQSSLNQFNIAISAVPTRDTFTVNSSATTGTYTSGGLVAPAQSNMFRTATITGAGPYTLTATTWGPNYLVNGQTVKISSSATNFTGVSATVTGQSDSGAYGAAQSAQSGTAPGKTAATYDTFTATVVVPAGTTFTMPATQPATSGTIGIADVAVKVYTTTNYWAPDDHCAGAVSSADCVGWVGTGSSAGRPASQSTFIANVSQWCTTCHTRYLAGSGSYKNALQTTTNTGATVTGTIDNTFTYRHRGNNGKEGSPNCIECHVSHGSNAAMGAISAGVKDPSGVTPGATSNSRLLRADSRGVCNMCHNL